MPDPEDSAVTIEFDAQGRPEPPLAAGEMATLVGFLDFLRATLAWKAAGLDAAGFATTVGPSTMTIGGMLKHLSYVEDNWCTERLAGRPIPAPWDTVDWSADIDWDWHSAADDHPDEIRELWEGSVARSRAVLTEALATAGPDQLAVRGRSDGRRPSLRWIVVHLIEEYGRHCGHADLLREAVDGTVGE